MKKLIFFALLLVLSLSALAGSQGNTNGQPFQQLQTAVDQALAAEAGAREAADAAEAAARAAADTAEAAAREAADLAESTTRAAQDAALAATLAAEEAARIAADMVLQQHINAEIAARLALEDRVSILEGFHFTGRSLTYEETAGNDIVDFSDIAGLNYQPGEWILIVGYNAASGIEKAVCSNNPAVALFLNGTAGLGGYNADFYDPGSFYNIGGGGWNPNAYLGLHSSADTLWLHGGPYDFYIYHSNPDFVEIRIESWGIGNTLTLNVDATRLDACGF